MDVPEFQRQVIVPAVPKISAALIQLVEQSEDEGLRVSISSPITRDKLRHRWLTDPCPWIIGTPHDCTLKSSSRAARPVVRTCPSLLERFITDDV
jgi:hypothetical protein